MEGTERSSGVWKIVKAATEANGMLANERQQLEKCMYAGLTVS